MRQAIRIAQACTLAGVLSIAAGCKNDLDRVAAVEVAEASPERVTHGAVYLFSDSGIVRNRLGAGTIAEWNSGTRRTELTDGVRLDMLDAEGRVVAHLTARRGVVLPGSNRMEVFDEVVFVNVRGERLETEHLLWQRDSALVRTERPVRIQRRNDVIHGIGLTAAEDFSRYTVRRITGVLDIPANDTLATDAPRR